MKPLRDRELRLLCFTSTGPVGRHSSVQTRWPYVAVVVVKRSEAERKVDLERWPFFFVLVCVFLGFLAEREPLALPSDYDELNINPPTPCQ